MSIYKCFTQMQCTSTKNLVQLLINLHKLIIFDLFFGIHFVSIGFLFGGSKNPLLIFSVISALAITLKMRNGKCNASCLYISSVPEKFFGIETLHVSEFSVFSGLIFLYALTCLVESLANPLKSFAQFYIFSFFVVHRQSGKIHKLCMQQKVRTQQKKLGLRKMCTNLQTSGYTNQNNVASINHWNNFLSNKILVNPTKRYILLFKLLSLCY